MQMYIVTIKLPTDPQHDPKNKKTGACLLSKECTDVTGAHHSVLVPEDQLETIRASGMHITRVERTIRFEVNG